MELRSFVRGSARGSVVLTLLAVGCQGADDEFASVQSELGATTTTNLQLQVSKNACAASMAQTYFKVTNASAASVPLAQISMKYWVNDTSLASIVPAVWYGGCVTSPSGTCVHPVTGVTAKAVRFAPACGPDASHQASWEITISTTDATALAAGQTWSGVQTAINLANYANFKPGSGTWYSGCASSQPFAADPHFAVYVNGDLVTTQGAQPPSCRAPVPPVAPDAGVVVP
jgi:hypothetical protein